MAERKRRTAEERAAEIDLKIADHKAAIEKLKAKKDAVLNPKPRLTKAGKLKLIMEQVRASGMAPEEVAQRLGITIE